MTNNVLCQMWKVVLKLVMYMAVSFIDDIHKLTIYRQ